jgi:hypothetical protein
MARNATTAIGATANPAMISGDDHPMLGPRLMATSREVAPTASVMAPGTSNDAFRRSVSGSTSSASSRPATVSGTWATKIHRHPNVSTIGPPATTPITGPPAATIDQ